MIFIKYSGQWTDNSGGPPPPAFVLRWPVDEWGAWIPALLTFMYKLTGA